MEFIVLGVFALLGCALLYLYDRYADVSWRLDMAEKDAVRWKEEAVKRGWKNPFEEIVDSLKASTEKLEAVAAQMRATTEVQRQNAEKWAEINSKLRAVNDVLAASNGLLVKAAGHFTASTAQLRPAPRAPAVARDPMVSEAVRKLEADLLAGRVETDPLKRN